MEKLPSGEVDLPYIYQVLRGFLPAPHLPWFKKPDFKPNDWLSRPFKVTFTSLEEWEAVFTIALLRDVEWDRRTAGDVFASIGNHSMRVVEDEKDPSHFWLHITLATLELLCPRLLPELSSSSMMNPNISSASTSKTLEARAVNIEGCDDLVLELRVRSKKARPCGGTTALKDRQTFWERQQDEGVKKRLAQNFRTGLQ
ncbi:hypothetical protein WAI453_009626 [Rhynchosporium graminicola]